MKKYFENLTTADEINAVYKALRVAFHPDNGGSAAAFQELTAQHAAALAALEQPETADGIPAELPAAVIGLPEHTETSGMAAELVELVEKASQIPGVHIELCGSWLWVTGETRPVREQLKALRFRFSGNKKAWYWHDPRKPYHRRHGRKFEMDEIRERHGSLKLA